MITLSRNRAPKPLPAIGNPIAERYRTLVYRTEHDDGSDVIEANLIGVTSCASGAGVSTVVADLAMVAAESCERPVLLLDLNGTRPLLAERLGIREDLGLIRALQPDATPRDSAFQTSIPNLSILGSDGCTITRDCRLDVRLVGSLLRKLKRDDNFVVVDLPVAESALCLAVCHLLDGILLVIDAERTDARHAVKAKQCLMEADGEVSGVVLNKYRREFPGWLRGTV